MDKKAELRYFIEDLERYEVEGLFSVMVIKNDKENIFGETRPFVVQATLIPPNGDNQEEIEVVRNALGTIGEVLRKMATRKSEAESCN